MLNISENQSDRSAYNLSQKLISRGFEVLNVVGTGRSRDRVWTLRCAVGHEFKKRGHHLWTREKCPMCHCPSVEENAARLLIECHFKKSFPNVRPDWFVSEEGNSLEIDMYNEELKLAFEYNGIHHYEPVFGQEYLEKTQIRDSYKSKLCEKFGIKLIHIKAIKKNTSKKKLIENIVAQLSEHKIIISQNVVNEVVNKNFVQNERTNNSLLKFLEETKFEMIEGTYENRFSRLKIKHTCGQVYSLSLKEMKKMNNHGVICRNCK